jgi:N-acetylmuramic acid 6-phosphate etherase
VTPLPPTEQRHAHSVDLAELDADAIIALMHQSELRVVEVLEDVGADLADAARIVADTFMGGGRIAYLGAGTSGHLVLLDAVEVLSTFGVSADRIQAFIATGAIRGSWVVARSEDDTEAAVAALNETGFGQGDVVVGVAASGTTPFVVAGLQHARVAGCTTIGVANNPDTEVLSGSDLPIFLDTGPEILTGSTRLKAGTAQKVALNRISTTAMVLSGRVMSNLMVELDGTNAKLKERCVRIVEDLTGLDEPAARALLRRSNWSVRGALDAQR